MGLFTDEYKKLLIIQYADKPNATRHIETILNELENIYNSASQFEDIFDLDLAVGKQLDILGKIVGIKRLVPFAVPKRYFGFSDNDNAFGFDNKFNDVLAKPFRDKFEIPYTDGELNDYDYRFFMRAKIIKNYAKSTMIDNSKLSIQNAIDFLFKNKGYIVDNKDMSMNIYIDRSFDFDIMRYIKQLDLIPRPQGVKYYTLRYVKKHTFGFYSHNTGFGDKFDDKDDETYFAEKILD